MKQIYLIIAFQKTAEGILFPLYLNGDNEWDNEFNDATFFNTYDEALKALTDLNVKGVFRIDTYLTNQ